MISVATEPNRPIAWEQWYKLAKDLDDLAEKIGAPEWSRLTENDATPFPQKSSYGPARGLPDLLYIHFVIEPGTSRVTDQYLAQAPETPWNAPDASLKSLLTNDDLFLVTKADECWCNSILQLLPRSGSTAYLDSWLEDDVRDTEEKRCCWSLKIPQVGETLDDNQSVIPAAYMRKWGGAPMRLQNAGEESIWLIRPACASEDGEGSGEIWLRFKRQETGLYQLTAAARLLIPDFITWPIKKEWMSKLKEYMGRIPKRTSGVKFGLMTQAKPTNMFGPNEPAAAPGRTVDRHLCLERSSPFSGPIFTCKQEGGEPTVTVNGFAASNLYKLGSHFDGVIANDKAQIAPGCEATYRDFQQLLNCVDVHDYSAFAEPQDELPDDPGCLTKVGVDPWEENACGSETCVEELQKVYAHTYNQLRKILELMEARLIPYSEAAAWPNCCFDGEPGGSGDLQPLATGVNINVGPEGVWDVIPSRAIPYSCAVTTNGARLLAFVVGGCSTPIIPAYDCRDDDDNSSTSVPLAKVSQELRVTGVGEDSGDIGGNLTDQPTLVVGPFEPTPNISVSLSCSDNATPLCDRCHYDSEDPEVIEAAGQCVNSLRSSLFVSGVFSLRVFLAPDGIPDNKIKECLQGVEVNV